MRSGNFVRVACVALVVAAAGHGAGAEATEPCTRPATEIFDRIRDNIVQVVSFGVDPFRVAGRVSASTGSGILIAPDVVLTNYHVIGRGQVIGVQGADWSQDAHLIGGDPALDIALLGLLFPADAAGEITFGRYDGLAIGQKVHAVGHPLGLAKTMTTGTISGLDRFLPLNTVSWTTWYIQTDAAISTGNSGGALVDSCGRVVGVVSMRSAAPGAEDTGYALPIDTVLPLIDEILETGKVARPWHGLYGQMINPLIDRLMYYEPGTLPHGFLVETVEPGSAADKAGLRGGFLPVTWGMSEVVLGGDVIVGVDGRPITSLEAALEAVGALEIGDTVALEVWRDGAVFTTEAEIEERPVFERDLWPSAFRQ